MSLDRKTFAALLSLSAAYFTLGTGSLAVIGLLPSMAADLATSPAAIANLLTVFALTFALAAPLSQVMLGHLPRRRHRERRRVGDPAGDLPDRDLRGRDRHEQPLSA